MYLIWVYKYGHSSAVEDTAVTDDDADYDALMQSARFMERKQRYAH